MKYLALLLPLIGALTTSAQTKTTVDSLRHTVTVAKHLHNGQVDVHLYYWEDGGRLDSISERLELWINKVDRMYERMAEDSRRFWKLSDAVEAQGKRIDSLGRELYVANELAAFNTKVTNGYIRKYDSLLLHRIGVYPTYKRKDTLALGPFYIY